MSKKCQKTSNFTLLRKKLTLKSTLLVNSAFFDIQIYYNKSNKGIIIQERRYIMLVCNRVKELRRARGLSQRDIGKMIGVTKVSVCGYENGTRTPSLESLELLADIFEVSTDYLLGRELYVVSDKVTRYVGSISEEDIEIIKEIKKMPEIYELMKTDPKRCVSRINKKI